VPEAVSTKALFRATKAKPEAGLQLMDLPVKRAPEDARRSKDFYPTRQPEAIRALLARDGDVIRSRGKWVWENACGDGAMVREIRAHGFKCIFSDVEYRGLPLTEVRSFYDYQSAAAPSIITNPPYSEINARDGHGRWLRHTLDLPGWSYCALLLSWDWPAARLNGLGALLDTHTFTRAYLMRWKLDFTGEGSPPQRNAWFVWDRRDPRSWSPGGGLPAPDFLMLDRDEDTRQSALAFGNETTKFEGAE